RSRRSPSLAAGPAGRPETTRWGRAGPVRARVAPPGRDGRRADDGSNRRGEVTSEVSHRTRASGVLDMKKVFTTGQVAKICKVAPRTVSKWFDSGRLRGYRIP